MSAPQTRNYIQQYGLVPTDKILDIGGAASQITEIHVDTLIDIIHPTNFPHNAESDLKATNFIQLDVCKSPFPLPNKSFDFCICSHTLEDLYDPRLVLSEMGRVARRGVIVTPSRGREMKFSPFDITDWMTGGVRVPGHSHHHWFIEIKEDSLVITPKYYPLLYSPEFHIIDWSGDEECEYYWEGEPKVDFWDSIDFRALLSNYRDFVKVNRKFMRAKRVLFWVDHPRTLIRSYLRLLRRQGNAFDLDGS